MILGLNILHNSSVSLMNERGEVIFASSEERFTRSKNDSGIPYQSLNYIFQNHCPPHLIKHVAIGDSCAGSYATELFMDSFFFSNAKKRNQIFKNILKMTLICGQELFFRLLKCSKNNYQSLLQNKLTALGLKNAEFHFFDHHLCHAASAHYNSPQTDNLIITLDGSGDGKSGLIGYAMKNEIRILNTLSAENSVGVFYKAVVSVLDFMPGSHEGKITGLAAFGNKKRFEEIIKNILYCKEDENSNLKIISEWAEHSEKQFSLTAISFAYLIKNHLFNYFKSRKKGWDEFRRITQKTYYIKLISKALPDLKFPLDFQTKADLAAAFQSVLENTVLQYTNFYLAKTEKKSIACAGGVFANVKLNQRLLEETNAESIFIFPAMGDEGLSMGAAQYFLNKSLNTEYKHQPILNYCLGAQYNFVSDLALKKGFSCEFLLQDELSQKVAEALTENKLVGFYQGASEFGPRALGHRSLLANPAKREVHSEINKRLHRTEFMPFAPVVSKNNFYKLFDSKKILTAPIPSQYMTITLNVKKEWQEKIPAVVHLDGTARPQIADPVQNPLYFAILQRFEAISGVPALINTSFNLHEEPIIQTPEEALTALKMKSVDLLVIGNFLIK